MIPSTPLSRHILVVVGEEPNSRAAMISPTFDKEERDNDLIGSVVTLGGMHDLSPAVLFERIGEISSALSKMDYSQESPVASTYVGDVPVSFQVLPEGYGNPADPEDDEPGVKENTSASFPKEFNIGDVGVAIRIGDRTTVVAGGLDDVITLMSDPESAPPFLLKVLDYLVLSNPKGIPILLKGLSAVAGGEVDLDEPDLPEEEIGNFIAALPTENSDVLMAEILRSTGDIVISKIGEDADYTGYLVSVPASEKANVIDLVLAISPKITVSAA